MNTNTPSVSNPVPTSIIADSFACAMAVMENHEQRIGKVEKTVVPELDLISKDDIANRVAKQVYAEDIAEHVSITGIAANIDCEEVAQAMDIDLSDLADNIDTDGIAESVAGHIDMYALAQEIDDSEIAYHIGASDVAEYIEASDIADYIDTDDVASCISIPDVAEQIVDNMKEGLSGSMIDAFVKAVNERDELRSLANGLRKTCVGKDEMIGEMSKHVKDLNEQLAKAHEELGTIKALEEGLTIVDGVGPNDAAPTPEVSNG